MERNPEVIRDLVIEFFQLPTDESEFIRNNWRTGSLAEVFRGSTDEVQQVLAGTHDRCQFIQFCYEGKTYTIVLNALLGQSRALEATKCLICIPHSFCIPAEGNNIPFEGKEILTEEYLALDLIGRKAVITQELLAPAAPIS